MSNVLLPELFGWAYFQQQGVWLVFIVTIFMEIAVDPDQMPCSSESGLDLLCLPVTHSPD